jgi:hypothetical protein
LLEDLQGDFSLRFEMTVEGLNLELKAVGPSPASLSSCLTADINSKRRPGMGNRMASNFAMLFARLKTFQQ